MVQAYGTGYIYGSVHIYFYGMWARRMCARAWALAYTLEFYMA